MSHLVLIFRGTYGAAGVTVEMENMASCNREGCGAVNGNASRSPP